MATNNAALFTPPLAPYNNAGENALGSIYAQLYGQPTTDLLVKDLRPEIFDAAPQGFYDLAILNLAASRMTKNDEFSWPEKGYGRDPVIATGAVVGGGNTITIPVSQSSMTVVTVDTLVGFPNGQVGTVSALNTSNNTMVITMQTGQTAPNVSVNDQIQNRSSVEADGASTVSQGGYRISTIERFNFIQIFAKGIQWGTRELEKWYRSGTTDYVSVNQKEMIRQYRVDISNTYWNGVLGQVNLSNGAVAKTADSIWSTMQKAGSPIVTTAMANIGAAIESAALQTEYNSVGQNMKYLYATPTLCRAISKYYKDQLLRYNLYEGSTSGGNTIDLTMDYINIGSSYITLVPFKRFEDTASFPASWQNMMFLLDQANIEPAYFMSEYMITTPDRRSGINLNTFNGTYMNGDFSIYFRNPLSSAAIIVS